MDSINNDTIMTNFKDERTVKIEFEILKKTMKFHEIGYAIVLTLQK